MLAGGCVVQLHDSRLLDRVLDGRVVVGSRDDSGRSGPPSSSRVTSHAITPAAGRNRTSTGRPTRTGLSRRVQGPRPLCSARPVPRAQTDMLSVPASSARCVSPQIAHPRTVGRAVSFRAVSFRRQRTCWRWAALTHEELEPSHWSAFTKSLVSLHQECQFTPPKQLVLVRHACVGTTAARQDEYPALADPPGLLAKLLRPPLV